MVPFTCDVCRRLVRECSCFRGAAVVLCDKNSDGKWVPRVYGPRRDIYFELLPDVVCNDDDGCAD